MAARSGFFDIDAACEYGRKLRSDRIAAEAHARWLAAERAALAQRYEEIGDKSARESRFNAIADIVAGSKTFNRGYYPVVAPRALDAEFQNDARHDGIIHSGLSFEPSKPILEQPILDHFSSPAVVGTSQGRAQAGVLKGAFALPRPEAAIPSPTRSTPMRKLFAACKRLDDHWLGDLIAVVFLSGLVPLTLFIGSILDGGM